MPHSAHQLLSQISEHKRDTEAEVLKQLKDYRLDLKQKIVLAKQVRLGLEEIRSVKMEKSAQATELMMLEQSIQEQQLIICEVECEIVALDMAITEQHQKWAEQHKKCKAHENMAHKLQRKTKRKLEQTQQKHLDDQYSAKMFVNQAR